MYCSCYLDFFNGIKLRWTWRLKGKFEALADYFHIIITRFYNSLPRICIILMKFSFFKWMCIRRQLLYPTKLDLKLMPKNNIIKIKINKKTWRHDLIKLMQKVCAKFKRIGWVVFEFRVFKHYTFICSSNK